jgi:pimeloyl-ACP methyl ester carboxylesterase
VTEFVRLPRVGHVPMWDDPDLVVRAVLGVTAAAPQHLEETPA